MKCEWKDGKFKECKPALKYLHRKLNKTSDNNLDFSILNYEDEPGYLSMGSQCFGYCPFCGANIRKPKPLAPIIVKSGETWVASFEGVDYLCRNNTQSQPPFFYYEGDIRTIPSTWKPFSEIEITDTIAKLRPMVKSNWLNKGTIHKLYGIDEDKSDIILSGNTAYIENYVLATVKDLEE